MENPLPESEQSHLPETVRQLMQALLRRRWWFLSIACSTAVATVIVVFQLPRRYVSEATLLVMQQRVPERYVVSTTTTGVSEALEAMTQDVLSRSRLESIIAEFGLYAEERRSQPPERVLARMRKDIGIEATESNPDRRTVNAFKISFAAASPQVAQRVTTRLASLFISENLKTRADQASNTAGFLASQLAEAQAKLAAQEKRISEFKSRHLGELPEQQQGNLAILAGLQTQLQNTAAAISRAEQQRVYLESLLRGFETMSASAAASAPAEPALPPGPLKDAQEELTRLRAEQRRLASVYTPSHPDVIKNAAAVRRAEAEVARLAAEQPRSTPDASRRAAPSDTQQQTTLAQVKSQLEANRVETESLARDYKSLQAEIDKYQRRLNQMPVREQEMATVLRDHELLKQDYADLLKKKLEAELATSLEKEQAGQQFRLVDSPSLPTVPVSPKRVKLSLLGALAGVVLGVGAAFAVDSRGRPFYSERALVQQFADIAVVGVPRLRTAEEERSRRRVRLAEWFAAAVLVIAVAAVEAFVYLHG